MPPPSNPAAAAASVSGPGKFASRSDGGPQQGQATPKPAGQAKQQLPDAKYGEQKTFQADQSGAPLSQTNQSPTPSQGFAPNPAAQSVVPMSAPTQRPGEPVTAGAALGPGPGTESLGIAPNQVEQQDVGTLASSLPVFEALSNFPDALPGARLLVNALKAKMSPQ